MGHSINVVLQQMAVMLDAGIPPDKALAAQLKGHSNKKFHTKISKAHDLVAHGLSLSKALHKQGLISRSDSVLLDVGEQSGNPADALKLLCAVRQDQAVTLGALRSGLVLPLAILAIGVIFGVVIKVFTGSSLISALANIFWPAACVLIAIKLLLYIIDMDQPKLFSALWSLPVLKEFFKRPGSYVQLAFTQYFYQPLLWQIRAGLPADRAISNCGLLLSNSDFKRRVSSASLLISKGTSLGGALGSAGLILSNRLRSILHTGDQSGQFDQAITHELNLQRSELKQKYKNMVQWWPRLAYVVVVVVVSGFFV